MKKLFSIVLAVVMVLSIASSALAFSWDAPADLDPSKYGYAVDVQKNTILTGAFGTSAPKPDDYATAVNQAPVFFSILVTVPDVSDIPEGVKKLAKLTVKLTSLEYTGEVSIPLYDATKKNSDHYDKNGYVEAGTYLASLTFANKKVSAVGLKTYAELNSSTDGLLVNSTTVYSMKCLDTDSAKVYAKIESKRPLPGDSGYVSAPEYQTMTSGDFKITVATEGKVQVEYKKSGTAGYAKVEFDRDPDNNYRVTNYVASGDGNGVIDIYSFLNDGQANAFKDALANKKVYMSNDNLRAAFGFNRKVEDSATWKANSTPIILDPTVGIPKTGDNASVIGFAMIMVAVVAAAVAVKKVNA